MSAGGFSDLNRDSTNLEVLKAFEIRESLLSSDPIVMCELLVGLPAVSVLDVAETGDRLRVTIETRAPRPSCPVCGVPVVVKDRDTVELTDLPCFGRRTILVWRKIRWTCRGGCGSFTEKARDRRVSFETVGSGGTMGDTPGWFPWPVCVGGGYGSGLWLAWGDGRGGRLRGSAG